MEPTDLLELIGRVRKMPVVPGSVVDLDTDLGFAVMTTEDRDAICAAADRSIGQRAKVPEKVLEANAKLVDVFYAGNRSKYTAKELDGCTLTLMTFVDSLAGPTPTSGDEPRKEG